MAGLVRGLINQTKASLEKFGTFKKVIKQNSWEGRFGWIKGPLYTLFVTDDLRVGKHVGTDKYGNRYYENKAFFIGRSRYVIYSDEYFLNYDGSHIPAEWHGWMHYSTDKTPVEEPPVEHKWIARHEENLSGTSEEYVPYSTTRPKIEAWQPPVAK